MREQSVNSENGQRIKDLREERLRKYRESLRNAHKVKLISTSDFELMQTGGGKIVGK